MKIGANSKKNSGFSLIELVVVIAIIAILSGMAISGIGMISGWKQKQCVKQLDAAIGETQMQAMSKGKAELVISRDSNENYWMQMTGGENIQISDAKISIYYIDDVTEEEQLLCDKLTISFDSVSGALLPMAETNEDIYYCKKIVIRAGETRQTKIRFVKDTGRHYIE